MLTLDQLRADPSLVYHHTAARMGYESRKGRGTVKEYKGRFGVGYIWLQPRTDTSKYVYVSYYIKRAD